MLKTFYECWYTWQLLVMGEEGAFHSRETECCLVVYPAGSSMEGIIISSKTVLISCTNLQTFIVLTVILEVSIIGNILDTWCSGV